MTRSISIMSAIEVLVFLYGAGYVISAIYWSRELRKFRGRDADVAIIAILGISTYWPFLCLLVGIHKSVSYAMERLRKWKKKKGRKTETPMQF